MHVDDVDSIFRRNCEFYFRSYVFRQTYRNYNMQVTIGKFLWLFKTFDDKTVFSVRPEDVI